MNTDLLPYVAIVGSFIADLVWGRISARLPLPEWLRLVTIFFWTGGLGVVAMLIGRVVMHCWAAPLVLEAAALGAGSLAKLTLGEAFLCFLLS